MACLICSAPKTIRAHLIPRAFAVDVSLKSGEKHVVSHPNSNSFRTTNTGLYDPDILCASCDGRLGKHEGYVFDLLKKVRAQLVVPGKLVHVDPIDGNAVVKFAAGVCWKYCVTKHGGRISVGPYVDVLANVAFERSDIPSSVDVAAFQLQIGDDKAYFYRTPLPDRKESVNVIRFSVGGFVFFLKIDKRANPSLPPAECWFRGKTAASFSIAPAESFEEWRMHREMIERSDLMSYFDRRRNAE